MYEQVLETFRKTTESNVQMQQELFKKWFGMWPGLPTSPMNFGEQAKQFQKKWTDTVNETIKRQQEFADAQFKIGLENIEKAFHLGEAKNPEELRTKVVELWKTCFNSLKQAYEAQFNGFQTNLQKWTELVSKASIE